MEKDVACPPTSTFMHCIFHLEGRRERLRKDGKLVGVAAKAPNPPKPQTINSQLESVFVAKVLPVVFTSAQPSGKNNSVLR